MAKYRKISPMIWNDAKFRSLSDDAKLVFFLLLTHPQTSSLGTLRAYIEGLTMELKWDPKAFREAFQELVEKGMSEYCEDAGLIWLPNFIKHNLPESPNVLKSWMGALDDMPECEVKDKVFKQVESLVEGLGKAFHKAFDEAFAKAMPNQEQKQEQKQEQEYKESRASLPAGAIEFLDFAKEFQESVREEHGNMAPKITDKLVHDGAIELDRCRRIEKRDMDEVLAACRWAVTDSFWGTNFRSLACMRKANDSGVQKIAYVIEAYRKSKKQTPKKEVPDYLKGVLL